MFKNSDLLMGEVRNLRIHLERLANVLYPDNGIEWFNDALPEDAQSQRGISVPGLSVLSPELCSSAMPVVSVSTGANEGLRIHCGVMHNHLSHDNRRPVRAFSLLSVAKTFGGTDESWGIARLFQKEMEVIFNQEQMSILPDLGDKLPRSHSFLRHTDLVGSIAIRMSRDEAGFVVDVATPVDQLDVARFEFEGATPYAEHAEIVAESNALQYAGAWGLLLSLQKHVRPTLDKALASDLQKALRRDPGGYGVQFNPGDFVANTAEFSAKPKTRRPSTELGLG